MHMATNIPHNVHAFGEKFIKIIFVFLLIHENKLTIKKSIYGNVKDLRLTTCLIIGFNQIHYSFAHTQYTHYITYTHNAYFTLSKGSNPTVGSSKINSDGS